PLGHCCCSHIRFAFQVGDYVLSPGIAVERKALDDLTQSLQSGRVFKQSEQMLRHYANSVLLIESNRKFESKIVNGGPFQVCQQFDLEEICL
ncbi:ERCC4 domain protein, partial [Cooperia oncophora]